MRGFLVETLADLGCPAADEFLDRGDIEVAVVEEPFQARHQPMHEAAILADRVATHRRLACRHPLQEKFDRAHFGKRHVDFRIEDALPESGLAMLVAVPVVHGKQGCLVMTDGERRAFGKQVQILVGDHRGDFEDGIVIGIEPGHFQIDPDQIVLVNRRHGVLRANE